MFVKPRMSVRPGIRRALKVIEDEDCPFPITWNVLRYCYFVASSISWLRSSLLPPPIFFLPPTLVRIDSRVSRVCTKDSVGLKMIWWSSYIVILNYNSLIQNKELHRPPNLAHKLVRKHDMIQGYKEALERILDFIRSSRISVTPAIESIALLWKHFSRTIRKVG